MFRTNLVTAGRIVALTGIIFVLLLPAHGQTIGLFESQQDIGTVLHPGSATADAVSGKYTLSGSGENMWFDKDDFHFVWKRLSGDVALTADVDFVGTTGNNHRKAVLMLRQSLADGSSYVDVARHGDGLTSLQYRQSAGANTHEVEAAVSASHRIRIEKRGGFAYLFASEFDGPLRFTGATIPITLDGEFYVGLGVCSHDKDAKETAVFSNVSIEPLQPQQDSQPLWSTLETVKVASTDRLVVYTGSGRVDSPVWAGDDSILIRVAGVRKQVSLKAGTLTAAPAATSKSGAGAVTSPDGKASAVIAAVAGAKTPTGQLMEVRTTSLADGKEKALALFWSPEGISNAPSWSPDGTRIAFVSYATINASRTQGGSN